MTEHAAATSSEIKSTALPNSPFPTRILKLIRDEEEWFSGSELKTDNSSSSDDEMSPTSQNLNKKFNKIKKRRKSKVNFKDCIEKTDDDSVSTTSAGKINTGSGLNEISSAKILRSTGDEKHANLLCTSIAESDEDDSEIYWRPKRETASLNLLRDHPDLSDSFTKTEKLLEDVSNIDLADDTVIEATKRMKNLEWDLLQAECRFEKEKGATDKVANDMLEYLKEITSFEGDAWNYIRSVIKQWIYYLKLHEVEPEVNDERFVAHQRKRNYKSLVRNRTKSKLGFIDKNIEAARLTKLKSNIRLPKLTKEDKVQLDELVKNSKNFALNEFKLQKSELDRLKEINSKLRLHRLESGASVVLNSFNEDEVQLDKLNKKSQQFVLHEYNLQNCELEKLKNIDYKLSEYKRDREDKDTNLNALYKDESQLDELCKQFAIHEYNLPKFEYQKLKALNSKVTFF